MSEPKIENMTLEDLMGDRFGRYSKSIIQERALPDIRDGSNRFSVGSCLP
mgnify:CR=1 FL=1